MTDCRNRYAGTEIKWIIAQRIDGGVWKIRYMGNGKRGIVPSLEHVLDETQQGMIHISEFGVFKNRQNWWEYTPRKYYRGHKVSTHFCLSLGGLINSLDSSWL